MHDNEPICTPCGEPIEGDTKYIVFFLDSDSPHGFHAEVGCAHHRPELTGNIGIAGSLSCATTIIRNLIAGSTVSTCIH